jgi:hypothetical protein
MNIVYQEIAILSNILPSRYFLAAYQEQDPVPYIASQTSTAATATNGDEIWQ